MLIAIETNNVEMREIYNQQIHENKRADQESKYRLACANITSVKTDGINNLM